MAVGEDAECIFRNYEKKRIEDTSEYLERAADKRDYKNVRGRGPTLHQN